jgi:hypothetical protein
MENGTIRKESRADPCSEYLSMGSKPIPFETVLMALSESGMGKLRVYIPYNRKQPLLSWFEELGDVFDEEHPLYESDTVTDVGVTWPIQDMVVFGLVKNDLIKKCKVHAMHLSAVKGAGSLEFSFTDALLRGIKACIYPEAARWAKASKRCGHKPAVNRVSFRNQCNGQELLAHFLAEMVARERFGPLMGYRIEYRITRSPNIFQTVRNLRDYDLFRWVGVRAYLGDAVQRMVVTDEFLELAQWIIPKAKSFLWDKGGHPSELDTMRTIEMWNFFGINSNWQQRGEQILLNLNRWREPTTGHGHSHCVQSGSQATVDVDMQLELAQMPEGILEDMRSRVRLRKTPKGDRLTVTLANARGRARKGTFTTPDQLYLSLYQEFGESWEHCVVTKN